MNYTTVDEGRLHVANDIHYQGNINSYNNCFTKSVTKLFGKSINITIGNSITCLNKNSYIKFLETLGVKGCTRDTIENFKNFDALSCTFINSKGLMRNHLTSSKTDELGREMIGALTIGDMQKATKLVYKGAEVNQLYWKRDHRQSITFFPHLTNDLPHQRITPFQAVQYTPFLQAVANNQLAFANLLEKLGANPDTQGKTCTFSRDIVSVNNSSHFQPTVHADVVHYNHHRHSHNRHYPGPRVVYRNGIDLVQTQTVTYEDRYENITTMGFDRAANALKTTGNKQAQTIQWNTNNAVGSYRLI